MNRCRIKVDKTPSEIDVVTGYYVQVPADNKKLNKHLKCPYFKAKLFKAKRIRARACGNCKNFITFLPWRI